MIKVNTERVIKNFKNSLDLTKDFSAFFQVILGKANDENPRTLRGGVAKVFSTKTDPDGNQWKPLTEKYLAKKISLVGNKPMGFLKGFLYQSFMTKTSDSVAFPGPRKLIYGTTIPYAKYWQGKQYKNRRPILGFTKEQKSFFKKLLAAYTKGAMQGAKDAETAAQAAANKVRQ